MGRLTSWVLAHGRVVVLLWLAVAVAGGVTAGRTVDRLSYDFALPGQPAFEANTEIQERFGGGGFDDPLLLVARGDDAERDVARVATQVERELRGTRTVTAADPGAGMLSSEDGTTSVAVVYPPVVPGPESYVAATPVIERVVARAGSAGRRRTPERVPGAVRGRGRREPLGAGRGGARRRREHWWCSSSCSPRCSPVCRCWSPPSPSWARSSRCSG